MQSVSAQSKATHCIIALDNTSPMSNHISVVVYNSETNLSPRLTDRQRWRPMKAVKIKGLHPYSFAPWWCWTAVQPSVNANWYKSQTGCSKLMCGQVFFDLSLITNFKDYNRLNLVNGHSGILDLPSLGFYSFTVMET